MSEELLHSYRLSSLEEPTDEMLHAIMEKVAMSARVSSAQAELKFKMLLEETIRRTKSKKQ